MNRKLRERDENRARLFYAQPTAAKLLEKYSVELDQELREDWVKTALYILYREGGMDAVFAAMNACRRAPGAANSDRNFNEKARRRMNGMSQTNLSKIVRIAQQAGIRTQGKFYVGGLGRYNDPAAWVSTSDDVLDVAKRRNLTVQGAVKHQGHEVPPPKPKRLADDLVNRYVKKRLASEPATREKVKKNPKYLREVREQVIDKHGAKKKSYG